MSTNKKSALSPASTTTKTTQELLGRSVTFSPKDQVTLVPSLSEMSETELASLYLTERDTIANQEDLLKNILAIRSKRQSTASDIQTLCFRGLEAMTSPQTMRESQEAKDAVIAAVLDEQDRQWDSRINDKDALAKASMEKSDRCIARAIMRAATDAAATLSRRTNQSQRRPRNQPQQQFISGILEKVLEIDLLSSSEASKGNPEASKRIKRQGM